jgi:hypothetical protein
MITKLEVPKPRRQAVSYKIGERPENDTSLIPHSTGDSVRLSFRADPVTLEDVRQHLRRLERMAPVMSVTTTDALRSLIQRGAIAYREEFPEPSTDSED